MTKNKNTKTIVKNYHDRSYLNEIIKNFYENTSIKTSSIIPQNQIILQGHGFMGSDFRNIQKSEYEIFNFSDTDISSVHIDRNGLEFFKPLIAEKRIKYTNLILDGADLGPKIYVSKSLGIKCIALINLEKMDLSGISLKNCNLERVVFDDARISQCNFSGASGMNPGQFCYAIGYEDAVFFRDSSEDQKFKDKIAKLAKKSRPELKPRINKTNNFFAKLFETPTATRLDDPALQPHKKRNSG